MSKRLKQTTLEFMVVRKSESVDDRKHFIIYSDTQGSQSLVDHKPARSSAPQDPQSKIAKSAEISKHEEESTQPVDQTQSETESEDDDAYDDVCKFQ